MNLFVPAKLPPTVYLFEAAQWIAFGIVPEFHHLDDGRDIRGDEHSNLTHMTSALSHSFFGAEAAALHILDGGEFAIFSDWLVDCVGETADDIQEQLHRNEELQRTIDGLKEDNPLREHVRIYQNENRQLLSWQLDIAMKATPGIKKMQSAEETARSLLFHCLVTDRINSVGFKCVETEAVVQGTLLPVPRVDWRMASISWEESNILNLLSDEEPPLWVGVQVETDDLFRIFPKPELPNQIVRGCLTGSALIVDPELDREGWQERGANRSRPRGKPQILDGAVRTAVLREFEERLENGYRPENQEQMIQDCIAWSETIFSENISRTTAQRYLAPLWSRARSIGTSPRS